MDCDAVVCAPLADLWATDLNGNAIGAVTDACERLFDNGSLGYPAGTGYFNSGVLLIDLAWWREHGMTQRFLNTMAEEAGRIRAHDQDVLNIMLHGNRYPLPFRYNVQREMLLPDDRLLIDLERADYRSSLAEAIADPAIVHFTGPVKPWHIEDCNPFGHLFHKYYKRSPYRFRPYTHYGHALKHAAGSLLRRLGLRGAPWYDINFRQIP